MEKQLERKKRFEEVSRIILQSVNIIKSHAKTNEFYPFPIDSLSSDVLSYLHDKQLKTIEIKIRPQKLELSLRSFQKEYFPQDFKNAEDIIKVIKRENSDVIGSFLHLDCDPIILSDSVLGMGDIFYNFKQFYSAYRLLEKYENDIVVVDNTILGDLKRNIDSLLKVFVESLVSEHKITISSADKSKHILRKLLNAIIDLESISVLLKELSTEICDKRLIAVQREIFSRS